MNRTDLTYFLFVNLKFNELLSKAIDSKLLIEEHAGGGNGTIKHRIETLSSHYGNVAQYKLTTLFDSDKTSENDSIDHNTSLKKFLSDRNFHGHELHKREIENYYSIETYILAGLLNNNPALMSLTPQAYDYLDIESDANFSYTKKKMQLLSTYMNKDRLIQRVSHHVGQDGVNEIQNIIILFAKYV